MVRDRNIRRECLCLPKALIDSYILVVFGTINFCKQLELQKMLDKLKKKLAEASSSAAQFIKLPEEQRNQRLDTCKSCEYLHATDFCKLCHCYMPVKTYIPSASCPQKKWLPVNISHKPQSSNS